MARQLRADHEIQERHRLCERPLGSALVSDRGRHGDRVRPVVARQAGHVGRVRKRRGGHVPGNVTDVVGVAGGRSDSICLMRYTRLSLCQRWKSASIFRQIMCLKNGDAT